MSQFGQDTGKDYMANGVEAREIIKLVEAVGYDTVEASCGIPAAQFLNDQAIKAHSLGDHYGCSGKQLFFLRDIKDKLVEKGLA